MTVEPTGGGTLAPERVLGTDDVEEIDLALPWNVVVWDDPINTMDYVVYVFRKVFGYSKQKANKLMREVHENGRSIVSSGPLEKAELDVAAMHRHTLWATMEKS